MSSFKPLTLGRLPRVMVKILAMSVEDRAVLANWLNGLFVNMEQKTRWHHAHPGQDAGPEDLAVVFAEVLDMSKAERGEIAASLDDYLDYLLADDFFGTEGQCDPRGDHRD